MKPNPSFERDPYPGRPKILFIGWGESSHTHAWIDLLQDAPFNVRLFALPADPSGIPADWPVRTYVVYPFRDLALAHSYNPMTRCLLYPADFMSLRSRALRRVGQTLHLSPPTPTPEELLARIIQEWQPDIIHTLGADKAGYFYHQVRERFNLRRGTWVMQFRGGPELALHRHLPQHRPLLEALVRNCDQVIADNPQNYQLALELGLAPEKRSELGIMPGTGGIDIDGLRSRWTQLPSQRERIILWPKAYEHIQTKALPILEALKLAWDQIKPCQIVMLTVVQDEIRIAHQLLPAEIRDSCILYDRLPRRQVFDWMLRARVMLAPSLFDGVPNSLYEAMACGAAPLVSPIETLTPLFQPRQHVIYARNLYPDELAGALVQAMTDDGLVDQIATTNVDYVRQLADRKVIRQRMMAYYERLAE